MNPQPSRRLKLILIDPDPVFRQGLIDCLRPYADVRIVLQADSAEGVLQGLERWFSQPFLNPRTGEAEARSLDLAIISLELGLTGEGRHRALLLCQQLKTHYPELPVLMIGGAPDPQVLAAAVQAGAIGYCRKGSAVTTLVEAIRQTAAGYAYWAQGMETVSQALTNSQSPLSPPTSLPGGSPAAWGPWVRVRRNLKQSGIGQIDQAIAQLNTQLEDLSLSALDYLVLTGRRRELYAARWLVSRLLKTPGESAGGDSASAIGDATPTNLRPVYPQIPRPPDAELTPPPSAEPSQDAAAIVLQPAKSAALRSIQAALLDTTYAKLQFPLTNLSETPLEIDILREDRKRELLTIVLRQLESILDELRLSQVELDRLPDKQAAILQDLWRASTSDFFGRYATLPVGNSPTENLRLQAIEIVEVLLQDAEIVQVEILNKIPLVSDLIAHLLFQTPLMIDNTAYAVGTVEAMARLELLLQNLIIQVGNAVMQPLLNRFGDVVAVKQNFYDRRLLSTREIERFRNNLSWKYRVDKYFGQPTAIFESRYGLYGLQELGIGRSSIYFPRNQELDQLSGIQLAVTIALEARDAISPRVRSAISFVGSGVVYLLTEVIGRGIGLIGRGVIKGVGNALQDTRFSRDSGRSR